MPHVEFGYVIGAIALIMAGVIVLMGELSIRRHADSKPDVPTEEDVKEVVNLFSPGPPDFASVEEIHSFYRELKDQNPLKAGQVMYDAQLKIHGR